MAPPQQQPQTPVRTHGQRMDALRKANEIRSQRAELKRQLKAGEVSILDVLSDPPDYLRTAKVMDLVLGVPKVGRVKATKVLQKCRVSPSKTVGGLSDRQRAELIKILGEKNGTSR